MLVTTIVLGDIAGGPTALDVTMRGGNGRHRS